MVKKLFIQANINNNCHKSTIIKQNAWNNKFVIYFVDSQNTSQYPDDAPIFYVSNDLTNQYYPMPQNKTVVNLTHVLAICNINDKLVVSMILF